MDIHMNLSCKLLQGKRGVIQKPRCINYGLSIIMTIARQIIVDFLNINLSNENINADVSREMIFSKIVSQNLFWHFNSHFVLKISF